ncbi:MAG: sigma-54-dependent Fis family transcriptional regulator [Acidobacteria bacterium]|nr:sigma-54-dependent Fis family transcriptional regulator [Acidobacteriota bacterium]
MSTEPNPKAKNRANPAPTTPDPMALIGESQAFRAAKEHGLAFAKYDINIFLEGETGTGKELFARMIHSASRRRRGPVVAVNCGAIPQELAESELFGHLRGAFTDAREDRLGLIPLADQGTLFLDEVSSMSPMVQAKLLRFLQNGEYRAVGSGRTASANVRVISACNTPLEEEARQGRFRWDLFYRLRVVALRIPPLRERPEDIGPLLEHFLDVYARKFRLAPARLSPVALATLIDHAWPGNVRELENMAQLLAIRHAGDRVEIDQLSLLETASPNGDVRLEGADGSFQEERERALGSFERSYLLRLLERHAGNVTRAADEAGKDRRTLTRLLKKHGIQPAAFRTRPR